MTKTVSWEKKQEKKEGKKIGGYKKKEERRQGRALSYMKEAHVKNQLTERSRNVSSLRRREFITSWSGGSGEEIFMEKV